MTFMKNKTLSVCFLMLFHFIYPQSTDRQVRNLSEVLVIDERSRNYILNAYDVVQLNDGSFIVSDKLDYKLKKFDKNGKFVKETGKRGKGHGEFRGPSYLASFNDVVAVTDFSSNRVQMFTSDLQFKSNFNVPGTVLDLCFDSEGNLWVGLLGGVGGQKIIKVDGAGNILQTILLKNQSDDIFESLFFFDINKKGIVAVCYMCLNKIEVWNTKGQFIRDFEVAGIPLHPRKKTIVKNLFSKDIEAPEDNIFWSLSFDNSENIYVLADAYTENPSKDVYVLDLRGNLLSILSLPERAVHLLMVSNDRMIAINNRRTKITVYGLKNNMDRKKR